MEICSEYIPLEEAARRAGSTPMRLLVDIKRKFLEGREEDGEWYVTESSLKSYMEKPEAPPCATSCAGRKSGCAC